MPRLQVYNGQLLTILLIGGVITMSLGKQLKEARINAGYSQKYVETALGFSPSILSKYEKNRNKPTLSSLVVLCEFYQIPLEFFEDELSHLMVERKLKGYWTIDTIHLEFQHFKQTHQDISDQSLRRNHPILRYYIQKEFGSYEAYLRMLNIDYDLIRLNQSWSKEKIIITYRTYMEREEDLSWSYLREKDPTLAGAITYHYGGYEPFLEQIGIPYESIRKYIDWAKKELVSEFREHVRLVVGDDLSRLRDSVLQKENPKLYTQIYQTYPTYSEFMKEMGYDYERDIRAYINWSFELIDNVFKCYMENGNNLKPSTMKKVNFPLFKSILRYYKGYKVFLELKGFNYEEEIGIRYWTDEELIEEFQALYKEGDEEIPILRKNDRRLYQLIKRHFNSYSNFLIQQGYDLEKIQKHFRRVQTYGHQFEALVKEMFEALGCNYEYHYGGIKGSIPDFYDFTNHELIDAKLSSWSVFKTATVEKYLPHCDQLTIVYLRGENIPHSYPKLYFKSVDEYFPLLKEKGLSSFIEAFEKLKQRVNAYC
jgi:transcriptional regulator with XRE-family HTH domain